MKKFLGIFILGLLWSNVGIADNSKLSPIGEMYKNCTSYIKLIRSENSNLSQDEQLSAILCDEFFAGLYGGIIFQSVWHHEKTFSYFYLIFYSRRYVAQKKPIQHNFDKLILYNSKFIEIIGNSIL